MGAVSVRAQARVERRARRAARGTLIVAVAVVIGATLPAAGGHAAAAADGSVTRTAVDATDARAGSEDLRYWTTVSASSDPVAAGTASDAPAVAASISVESSTEMADTGTVLAYTLTFRNDGSSPMPVNHVDYLADVLDDATLSSVPIVSSSAIAVGPIADSALRITGSLAPEQEATVAYAVTVKGQDARGNHRMENELAPVGKPPSGCYQTSTECTATPLPNVRAEMRPFPDESTVVQEGDTVLYSIELHNEGEIAGAVDYTLDLSGAFDDASLTGPITASEPALAFAEAGDGRIRITGMAAPRHITSAFFVLAPKVNGSRGDNVVRVMLAPTDEVAPECGEIGVSCAEHMAGETLTDISVDPSSGATVRAGSVLAYTLTFRNPGSVPGKVDAEASVMGLLDDADITSPPYASSDALTVSDLIERELELGAGVIAKVYRVTGQLAPGETATVRFQATVKPDGERGDDRLDAFVLPHYLTAPEICEAEPGWPCTVTYVGQDEQPSPSASSTPVTPSATPSPTTTASSPVVPGKQSGPTGLPTTGMDLSPAPFVGAMALLGLGTFILIARRRATSRR